MASLEFVLQRQHGPDRMTVTESRPETDAESEASPTVNPYESPGFAGALATGDHKTIGRMYMLFGLVGVTLALVLDLLVSLERTNIDSISILDWGNAQQTFFQAWSLGRTSLLFFGVLPLLVGLATYVVPLQVGASSISCPRATAAAFWAWLIAMGMHVATVLVDGGLGVPQSPAAQGSDPEAIELSLLSIGVATLALMLATVCILTTIIAQRPRGMTLYEVPLFSWSMLVAGGIWLLSFPVWLANLAIIWSDFRGDDAVRFGNVQNIWAQLDWLWSQPMIFAFAIPVLGIVGEIVPVAAQRRQAGYGLQQSAIAVLGVLSFGAWAQSAFNTEVSEQTLFVVMGVLVALPILVFFGGLARTLKDGSPQFSSHLVLGLMALITLLMAAAAAALRVSGPAIGVIREIDSSWLNDVIEPLEDLRGTVIATGVMELTLVAAMIGAVAGLHYWAPKIFGRTMSSSLGILSGLALLGGAVLVGVANIVNGFLDEGDRVFETDAYNGVWDEGSVELFNVVVAIGVALLILGVVMVLADTIRVLVSDLEDDVDDPWNGHTLAWATASPPATGNFAEAPTVHSERPLLDATEAEED